MVTVNLDQPRSAGCSPRSRTWPASAGGPSSLRRSRTRCASSASCKRVTRPRRGAPARQRPRAGRRRPGHRHLLGERSGGVRSPRRHGRPRRLYNYSPRRSTRSSTPRYRSRCARVSSGRSGRARRSPPSTRGPTRSMAPASRVLAATRSRCTPRHLSADDDSVRVRTRFVNPSCDTASGPPPLPTASATSTAECAFATVERGLERRAARTSSAFPPSRPTLRDAGGLTVVHEGSTSTSWSTSTRSTAGASHGPSPSHCCARPACCHASG